MPSAFRSNLELVVAGLAESPSCVEKLTHAHRKVSRGLVRCTGVTGSGHIVDAAAAERPDSMLADRPPASSSLDETIWRAACKPAAQPISVEPRASHRRINQPTESINVSSELIEPSAGPTRTMRRREVHWHHQPCLAPGRACSAEN